MFPFLSVRFAFRLRLRSAPDIVTKTNLTIPSPLRDRALRSLCIYFQSDEAEFNNRSQARSLGALNIVSSAHGLCRVTYASLPHTPEEAPFHGALATRGRNLAYSLWIVYSISTIVALLYITRRERTVLNLLSYDPLTLTALCLSPKTDKRWSSCQC